MTTPTALILEDQWNRPSGFQSFDRAGYRVFSASRNPHRAEISSQFIPVEFDLLEIKKIAEFSTKFIRNNGIPDLLINNVGCGAFYDGALSQKKSKQINLLFTSPIILCKHFAPEMAKGSKGIILNLSSLATLYPLPFMPLYNAGKSALSSFTESMMLEYHESPKFIDFRMGDIRTKFNQVASAQPIEIQSIKMKKAWSVLIGNWKGHLLPRQQHCRSLDPWIKEKAGELWRKFFSPVILPVIHQVFTARMLQEYTSKILLYMI